MSNAIRYDPLLIRYLSEELDELLRGRPCASQPFFASGRVALLPLDRGEALEMDLHPTRGWFRLIPWEEDGWEADARCTGVTAPADERRLTIGIEGQDRFRDADRRLEVELHTNQWNVLLVASASERIHSALWARRAGDRALTPGAEYRPPPPSARAGVNGADREGLLERWMEGLRAVPPVERMRVLVRQFAWTGTVNGGWILGAAGEAGAGDEALREAFERWWWLRSFPPADPVVLVGEDGRLQPYPVPLEGYDAEPAATLLGGMDNVASRWTQREDKPGADRPFATLLGAARLRLEAAQRRLERLEGEVGRREDAERLRTNADLLLSRLHEVERGAEEVVLRGWDGEAVRLRLDPTASPAENAAAWYSEARKRERAAARLPGLIEAARGEVRRWGEAVAQGEEEGALPEWVEREVRRGGGAGGTAKADQGPPLPYRSYRSSGGLEIRVGRSSRTNDDLTFRHSSPNDIWLHARSVPGSHVILRWANPEGSPPARDLEEAARLAAFHSKARTSAIVPVDWTRRKYVRKPRGAPPGAVVPQRVRTLFVALEGAE